MSHNPRTSFPWNDHQVRPHYLAFVTWCCMLVVIFNPCSVAGQRGFSDLAGLLSVVHTQPRYHQADTLYGVLISAKGHTISQAELGQGQSSLPNTSFHYAGSIAPSGERPNHRWGMVSSHGILLISACVPGQKKCKERSVIILRCTKPMFYILVCFAIYCPLGLIVGRQITQCPTGADYHTRAWRPFTARAPSWLHIERYASSCSPSSNISAETFSRLRTLTTPNIWRCKMVGVYS